MILPKNICFQNIKIKLNSRTWMIVKSSVLIFQFLLISDTLSVGGCWGRCYFFKNWWMKLKFPNLLKALGTIIQQICQSFYPSEPFSFDHFNMIHPVGSLSEGSKLNQALELSPKKLRVETKLVIYITMLLRKQRAKKILNIAFCIFSNSGNKFCQCGYWWCDFGDLCCFCIRGQHCNCCNLHEEKNEIANKHYIDW